VGVPAPLPLFEGEVYEPTDGAYKLKAEQYATQSENVNGSMQPAAVIFAESDDDVIAAIKYAKENKVAIAIRTGGHMYTGASSTGGPNIQLDMSQTYRSLKYDKATNILEFGISRRLDSVSNKIVSLGLFVPHGQCSHVHAGGHAHTGGYGLIGRAFGLYGDHIQAIRVITADCQVRWIDRNTTVKEDAELFWAVLGGSPGNFAVLTHLRIKPNKKEDYPNAKGMRIITQYTRPKMEALLKIKAEMVDNPDLPADWDMCITVMSAGELVKDDDYNPYGVDYNYGERPVPRLLSEDPRANALQMYGVSEEKVIQAMEDVAPEGAAKPGSIIVFAQWANLQGKDQKYDPTLFDRIKKICGPKSVKDELVNGEGLPLITTMWYYNVKKEYNLPFVKRTWCTNKTNLSTSGWVDFTLNQCDKMFDKHGDGFNFMVQIQNYGGKYSRYATKDPENKTSYSWRRDTTLVHSMDCFYPVGRKEEAVQWQKENDKGYKGPNGVMSPGMDRRVLWGTYHATPEEKDLYKSWPFYHEDKAKWDKLVAIKKRVDPSRIFSSNPFSV